jgi:hypothetical protein
MIRRQTQAQGFARVQIGVIRVGGQEGIAFGIPAPPSEMRFRPGHLHEAQTRGLQAEAQTIINPRFAFTQQGIGDAQW